MTAASPAPGPLDSLSSATIAVVRGAKSKWDTGRDDKLAELLTTTWQFYVAPVGWRIYMT